MHPHNFTLDTTTEHQKSKKTTLLSENLLIKYIVTLSHQEWDGLIKRNPFLSSGLV
jgi:hypothetical protein